jgi:cytochrome P450
VLFAAKPAHIREFLKIPVSAFTPPMPNPIEPVVGDGSIILLYGVRHKQERARFLPALHHDRIRRYTGLMVEAALDEIAKWQPGTTIDTRDAAQSITLQIIVQAVFGIEDRNLRDRYVTVVKAMMRDYVAPFMFFPALRRAPFGLGPWRRFSARRVGYHAVGTDFAPQTHRRRRLR